MITNLYKACKRLDLIDAALIVEWQAASLAIYKSTYVLVALWTRAIRVKAQAIG